MGICDIENLSAAELKAQKAELLEAAKATPVDDLAARYLQARTDAKQRDEKLAEQAETLAALREGLKAVKEREAAANKTYVEAVVAMKDEAAAFKKCADETIDELRASGESLADIIKDLQSANAILAGQNADLDKRCSRLKTQADRYVTSIANIQRESLLAINSHELDQADEGE